MHYYFNSISKNVISDMHTHLSFLLSNENLSTRPIIIMCIGSDRSTGDSLGPIIGYKLEKYHFENVYVYGSLNSPIHAANLKQSLDFINKMHRKPYIIAIDASLGIPEHIGYITLGTGPLKPGLGVKKKLPEVGNIHITGIVNALCGTETVTLQTTRLSCIMSLADIISAVLVEFFYSRNNFNACLYTQPVPVPQYLPRRTSYTNRVPEAYLNS